MAAKDQGLGGEAAAADAGALGDAPRIRAILTAAARDGRSVSYSEILGDLGFRFTRPKMRALCKTLGEVDRLCALDGEPDLAVLVVRESDRLPGQGWWVGAPRCCSATTARGKAPPRRASSANSNRSRSIIGRRDRPENIAARGKGSGMLSDAIAT